MQADKKAQTDEKNLKERKLTGLGPGRLVIEDEQQQPESGKRKKIRFALTSSQI